MQFQIGAIPETPNFLPEASWKALREPTPWAMQCFALPLGIIAGAIVGALWWFLTPLRNASVDSLAALLVALIALMPIHELVHAAVHPSSGMSDDSILGFWPSRLLFYAHYRGELSRTWFIVILLMPLLVISFVPLLACVLAGRSSGLLAFISSVNALGACGDIFGVGLLLFQVPSDGKIRNQGWRTFWKMRDEKPASRSDGAV